MNYAVKEIFYSLQGEGANLGKPSVFCRFSGCNIWNGREEDKSQSPCWFCDTDFVGTDGDSGGVYRSPRELAEAINTVAENNCRFVIFTGGEPLLQLDTSLINELKARDFEIAVETNGTIEAPEGIDWLTVSPKSLNRLVQKTGNELKLLYPFSISPEEVADLNFDCRYLSPINLDNETTNKNAQAAIDYAKSHPEWRVTLQYHKLANLP